ncbi:MAG: RNA polymerase sigma factor [Anaeroplasma sp.]
MDGKQGDSMNLEKLAFEYINGNEDAFDLIYKETISFVRVAIYQYVQDPDVIDDLVQDTYMKAINNLKNYQNKNINNWLYTIAKNTALDYVKKKKETKIEDVSLIPDRVKLPYLNYAISHLDELERNIFLFKVLCSYTTKKIATLLDVNINLVNKLYYQAKEKLKKELEALK